MAACLACLLAPAEANQNTVVDVRRGLASSWLALALLLACLLLPAEANQHTVVVGSAVSAFLLACSWLVLALTSGVLVKLLFCAKVL